MKNNNIKFPANRLPLLLKCPASAAECCGTFKGSAKTQPSQKGTWLHCCFEENLDARLRNVPEPYDLGEYATTLDVIVQAYQIAKAKDPDTEILIEYAGRYANTFPCTGRMDVAIVTHGRAGIFDLKSGQREINPINPTMLAYALILLNVVPKSYDLKTFQMVIFQPTKNLKDGFRTRTISKEEVMQWATKTLIPVLKDAMSETPTHNYGAHCKDCSARKQCPFFRKAILNVADALNVAPDSLNNEQLSRLLSACDAVSELKKQLTGIAETRLKNGETIEGYGLKEKTTQRKWNPEEESKIKEQCQKLGLLPEQYTKLKTPAAIQKEVGNDQLFQDQFGALIQKKQGEKTLSPISHI